MRRRPPLIVVGAAAVALVLAATAAAVVGYRQWGPEDRPLRTNRQRPAPPLAASTDPERGEVRFADSGRIVEGATVDVLITVPAGATEMQVGLDPTFTATEWQPVSPLLTLTVPDAGYQMVFGRFRTDADTEPTEVSVDGITIDPTFDAATASADGLHRASWVRPLSTTAFVVRIETGRVDPGRQIPYDFDQPPDGDDVSGFPANLFGPREVRRNGGPFGREVADGENLLRTYDRLLGRPIDPAALLTGRWTVTAVDDPSSGPIEPVEVRNLTRPVGNGLGPGGERFTPLVHDLVLRLPTPVRLDGTYRVDPPAGLVEPVEVTFDPGSTVSPAVHVNQNGYRPDDPIKIGYLTGYVDDLGQPGYRAGMPFRVIERSSGATVYEGTTTARPGGDELGQGDLTGAPAFELDFSPVVDAGRYQACVDGVGCSEEFDIDDRVWDDLTVTVARSMYHQRSGVALGPPFTAVARPRPYHPDDGLVVVESEYRLIDSIDAAGDERFVQLAAQRTDRVVEGAWGGHFDAGDWDRRIEHLYYVRAVAELVELHPDRFEALTFGIPESANAIPDLLDEGLWTLDLFRRLQRADGAIPGGIEAAEHPLPDTTSWSDPLAVFTYRPDPLSTYLYAGVAAQVAAILDAYAADEADRYLASAELAMAWAEAQAEEPAQAELVQAHRSVAAVALFKATGDERWHELFRRTTSLGQVVDPFLSCNQHTRCDAGWLYLTIDPSRTDPDLRAAIADSFVATADEIVAAGEETALGWTLENRFVPLVWGLGVGGAPGAVGLMRAYELTGDERYRGAALRSAAVTLGANPTNTVFITGVGRTPVRHPLIVDTLHGGLAVWPGTPVYGNHQLNTLADEGWVEEFVLGPAGIDPLPTELPYLWQWMDVPDVPMFNEFTVFQSHGPAIYAFGLLAAADRS